MEALRVEHDAKARRYVLAAGATVLSEITYSVSGDTRSGETVAFEHTTTPVRHRGKGYAAKLTQAALEDLRARGRRLVPACPYTRAYLRRHPEEADVVADVAAPLDDGPLHDGPPDTRSHPAFSTVEEQAG
jgi:predicted GNAT family acetyltransferase